MQWWVSSPPQDSLLLASVRAFFFALGCHRHDKTYPFRPRRFPSEHTKSLTLKWLGNSRLSPVMASVFNFNAKMFHLSFLKMCQFSSPHRIGWF